MRIITEDNIDQLTSMNYKNTIEIIKDNVLIDKERSEYDKLYTKKTDLKSKANPNIKIKKLIEEKEPGDEEKEPGDEEKEPGDEEKEGDEDDDDDDSELSQVTRDSIAKAEEEYKRSIESDGSDSSDDSEESKKEPISIGETIQDSVKSAFDNFVEKISPTKEDSKQMPIPQSLPKPGSDVMPEPKSLPKPEPDAGAESVKDRLTDVVDDADDKSKVSNELKTLKIVGQ